MNILVIDRESITNQLIASKLAIKGHTVVTEPNKTDAVEKIKIGNFDCVMVDPYPLSEARPVILGIWNSLPSPTQKPYLLLLSKTATQAEAIMAGSNDVLHKPLSSEDLYQKVDNAARLISIKKLLSHDDNVHSASGMIGKAAFNQLFLSAIDRAFTYGERSLIVFVSMINYDTIAAAEGEDGAKETVQKLAEKMNLMRRQSDVIGRLGSHDFGILLQRPQYESEPLDAIERFSETLDKFYGSFKNKALAPRIHLNLIDLPQGALHEERYVPSMRSQTLMEKEEPHV